MKFNATIRAVLLALIVVPAGGNLQQALDNARPGDEIVLPAGSAFVGSFVLPKKDGKETITIRTEGSPMAKILAPGKNLPALTSAPGAANYLIKDLEFGKATPSTFATNLILLGDGSDTRVEDEPSHITLDHIYAHGDPESDLRRCIALNGSDLNVLNSRVEECHERGTDSQAVAGWNGPGPFRIENNYLSAASENILFGGADPKIPGLVPSDIVIRGNTVTKSLAWKGKHFVVKNLIEFKNARNVLVEGNTFENSWTDGQTGTAILVKSADSNGACTWCISENITFRNNVIRNAEEGVRINAAEGKPLPLKARNITFSGDRFENISGKLFQIFGGVANVTIKNVQGSSGTGILFADTAPNPGLVVRNSTFINRLYGVGAGAEEGQPYLDKWFPGAVWENNTIMKTGSLLPATTVSKGAFDTVVAATSSPASTPAPVSPQVSIPVPPPSFQTHASPALSSASVMPGNALDSEIAKLMDWLRLKLIQNNGNQ